MNEQIKPDAELYTGVGKGSPANAEMHSVHQKPGDQVPFGREGARFLCNLLQHGVFLGFVVLLLMILGYLGGR